MEQQFILRLPEQLQSLDLGEARLVKRSAIEVALVHGDTSYPGVICRLPTIVESQKDIDGKLFKVADVSTVVVIFAKKDIDAASEKTRIEADGLTPPMGHAREKRVQLPEDMGEIDKRLAELLKEDARAEGVEFFEPGAEESSEDLDLLAAEIEENIREAEISSKTVPGSPSDSIASTPGASPAMASKSSAAPSPVAAGGQAARDAPGAINSSASTTPTLAFERAPSSLDNLMAQAGQPAEVPSQPAPGQPMGSALDKHPDVVAIKNKIREKQELLDKALNPILKKRFAQALAELEAELEAKRRELGND